MANKTLFGGALFAAGLAVAAVGGSAHAGKGPSFTFPNGEPNLGQITGLRAAGGYFVLNPYAYGPEYFGYDGYSGNGLDAAVFVNPSTMGMTHVRDPANAYWTHSSASTNAWFSVSADVTIQLDWDFGTWDQKVSWIILNDLGDGSADYNATGGAGSTTIDLHAGELYELQVVSSGFTGGGDSFGAIRIVTCDWDLDGDDVVGTSDLILLLGAWGDPYGTADLIELLGNWGPCGR